MCIQPRRAATEGFLSTFFWSASALVSFSFSVVRLRSWRPRAPVLAVCWSTTLSLDLKLLSCSLVERLAWSPMEVFEWIAGRVSGFVIFWSCLRLFLLKIRRLLWLTLSLKSLTDLSSGRIYFSICCSIFSLHCGSCCCEANSFFSSGRVSSKEAMLAIVSNLLPPVSLGWCFDRFSNRWPNMLFSFSIFGCFSL